MSVPGGAPRGNNAFRTHRNSAFDRVASYEGYRPGGLFQPGPINFGELSPESGGTGATKNLLTTFGDRTPPSGGGGAGAAPSPVPVLPTTAQQEFVFDPGLKIFRNLY